MIRLGKIYSSLNRLEKINRLTKTKFLILILLMFVATVISIFLGAVNVQVETILKIFLTQIPLLGGYFHFTIKPSSYEIVTILREPTIIAALFIGATLGVGGAVIQSIFRNPITEPYIIGISSGATLGVVLVLAFGISLFGLYTESIFAFIFAMAIVSVVFMVSVRSGKISGLFLLLVGIALSYFVSAIVAFFLFSNIKLQNEAFFWLLGSIGLMTTPELIITIPIMTIAMILTFMYYRELNALQMGDEYARSVGVNVNFSKGAFLMLTAISVSAAVSISGLIGFVGLIIPHISRLLFGGSNKFVIPSSAIIGATFLLICNDIARNIAKPEILPIGIVTGLLGVPIFIILMMKISKGAYEA